VEGLFKQCFHDHYERLHRYAFAMLKDNQQAKDIVQSAFVKLWEKRKDINIVSVGRSYLYTSVYRLCLNSFRDRKIKDSSNKYLATPMAANKYDPAEEREIRNRIYQAIETLPPRCKEVFCKSRLEGKKYSEIASELSISVKTVEVQMGKALKILREILADIITTLIFSIIYFL